ncbi:NlpC/P60 family protein [Nocardia sp. NPDC004860]|uniref:C40 family peptidase n=1 Tax=Nocardia sp. NPDC004860 TaxID=3154557 RepID=UPI0033A5A99D
MSDPISLIATIVTAATGALDRSGLPDDAKSSVHAAIEAGSEAAQSLTIQLDSAVAQLPEPARQSAREGVDDAADRIAALVTPGPALAQPNSGAAEAEPPTAPDDDQLSPQTVAVVPTRPSGGGEYSIAPAHLAAVPVGPAALPPITTTGNIAVFVPWFRQAGALCPGITAPTLAALYAAENGFRYGPTAPVSPAGALGPGQFMPATWAIYGKDVHGTGVADVFDVGDSVMASGHLLCDAYQQIQGWKTSGLVAGDTLDLTLAAYNAGAGAVLRSGGMPSDTPDYDNQTRPYVARIRAIEEQYAWLSTDAESMPPSDDRPAEDLGRRIVDQALQYLGLPYVWGGGGSNGPSSGGFDCSGLTSFAVHAATGGAVTLPRTSQSQWQIGTEIPLSEAVPGDLLFGNWGPDGPGHVAIYLGNGRMIHAPTTGDVVRVSPIPTGMQARRVI